MEKRLFFGVEVQAPWPLQLPPGRIVEEKERHLTLCFIGNSEADLTSFPPPPFSCSLVGKFNACLFLPEKIARVAAWNIEWLEDPSPLIEYQSILHKWLINNGLSFKDRLNFLPHVTLARAPFNKKQWLAAFEPLPCYISAIHLFESLGHSHYRSLSHHALLPPFVEIEHTADRAFIVQGKDMASLYRHALIALAFHFPKLLDFFMCVQQLESLEAIVYGLNQVIFYADKEVGSPYKAVSHHGTIEEKNGLLTWEMFVDV